MMNLEVPVASTKLAGKTISLQDGKERVLVMA